MATTVGAKTPVKVKKIETAVEEPHGHEVNKLSLNPVHLNPKDPNHQFVLSLHQRALEAHNGDEHKAASHVLNKVAGYASQTHRSLIKSGHTVEGNTHAPEGLQSHAQRMGLSPEGISSHGILHATALGLSGSAKAADVVRQHHEESIKDAQMAKNAAVEDRERVKAEVKAQREATKEKKVTKTRNRRY